MSFCNFAFHIGISYLPHCHVILSITLCYVISFLSCVLSIPVIFTSHITLVACHLFMSSFSHLTLAFVLRMSCHSLSRTFHSTHLSHVSPFPFCTSISQGAVMSLTSYHPLMSLLSCISEGVYSHL